MNLLEHIENSIRARKLFKRGERILVAVSGGVDSMVLLHALHSLASKMQLKLVTAHFNHKLRGRASDGDEKLVLRVAASLGLQVETGDGDVRQHANRNGVSIEMAARELRHKFLAQTAARLKIHSIAFAHHADDQVELFFLRLFRGSGTEGLAGMKWRSCSPADAKVQLVRPLLDISKAELEQFARDNKIAFRADATNDSLDFQRNRIRRELLPLLKKRYQPAINEAVLRVMNLIRDEAGFVNEVAERWLKSKRLLTSWPAKFEDLPPAIQRRCLQLQLRALGQRTDFELIEKLRCRPGRRVSVGASRSVIRNEGGQLQLAAHEPVAFGGKRVEIELDGRSGTAAFGGVRFRWKIERNGRKRLQQMTGREAFDAEKVGPRIVLRHWRAGDRFQPIGMASSVKLQDWFTNRKIPRPHRHELAVAESSKGEVFWIEGERISERYKLTARTRKCLIWRWKCT